MKYFRFIPRHFFLLPYVAAPCLLASVLPS